MGSNCSPLLEINRQFFLQWSIRWIISQRIRHTSKGAEDGHLVITGDTADQRFWKQRYKHAVRIGCCGSSIMSDGVSSRATSCFSKLFVSFVFVCLLDSHISVPFKWNGEFWWLLLSSIKLIMQSSAARRQQTHSLRPFSNY